MGSTHHIAMILLCLCWGRMWRWRETICNFEIIVGIENWEFSMHSSKKESRKDGNDSNPSPAKENDGSKIKIGTIKRMCPPQRAKSTKYATSDIVITNRSGPKEIAFGAGSCVGFTSWNGRKLPLINLYYLCSCVHPQWIQDYKSKWRILRYLYKLHSRCYSCEYFQSTHQCLKWD